MHDRKGGILNMISSKSMGGQAYLHHRY